MGDYTKLIVNADVKADLNELKAKIKELGLYESAYHCGGSVEDVEPDGERTHVILVGQTKYGRGQEEFLDWLEPFVVQGSGKSDVWSVQFDEYSDTPTFRSLCKSRMRR